MRKLIKVSEEKKIEEHTAERSARWMPTLVKSKKSCATEMQEKPNCKKNNDGHKTNPRSGDKTRDRNLKKATHSGPSWRKKKEEWQQTAIRIDNRC